MNILLAAQKPFAAEATHGIRSLVTEAGHTLTVLEKYSSVDELIAAASQADAMIVRSDLVDETLLSAAAPRLKVVVRAGAGYDNVDLESATKHGVCVMNTPGQNSNAVAELVFGLAVMAARNMYDGTSGSELRHKRLGIHAFGQVGRNVARIARGFEMKVSALDPFCPDQLMTDAGVTPEHSLENLYTTNHIVSLHIPATEQTRQSVNAALITLMPKGGILINTARKEVIDEASLAEALNLRPDIRYMADVRPDNADELLARFPRQVFFTPKKMGAQTAEANINAGLAAARQCIDFLATGAAPYRVNN